MLKQWHVCGQKWLSFFAAFIVAVALSSCSPVDWINEVISQQPSVKVSSSVAPYFNKPIVLTLEFSEPPSAFSLSSLSLTNGTLSNLTGGPLVYQVTLTPQLEGAVQVRVPGVSLSSSQIVSDQNEVLELYYDATAPVISSVVRDAPLLSPSNQTAVQVKVQGVGDQDYVELFSDPSCSTSVGTAMSSGTTVSISTNVFVTGSYTFYAKATDRAGNTSPCSVEYAVYDLDVTPPALTSLNLTLQEPASSPGMDKTPTLRATGIDDAFSVYFYSDSACANLYGSALTAGGMAEATSNSDLSDGTYQFHVRLADQLTNVSSCSATSVTYVLTTAAPSSPTSLALISPATSPNNDSTPTVRVLGVVSGHTVKMYTNNTCTNEVATGVAGGTTIDLTPGPLTDGAYNFYARSIDMAGNSSSCSMATVQYDLDTVASAVPSGISLQNPSVSPSNDSTPTLRISGVVTGEVIKLFTNNICTTEVASGTAAGSIIDLTSSVLVDGSYDFYAKALDAAGNASACSVATVNYIFDGTAPTAPSALALQSPLLSPSNDTTPTIRVSGVVSGDNVKLFTDSSCTTEVANGTAAATTIDLTSSVLVEGSYNFYARSRDSAGNSSNCSVATVAYTLDTTAPANPTGLALQSPVSSPGNDSTPTIRVSGVSNGDTVRLFTDNLCATEKASGAATGASIDLTTSILADATYNFYVTVVDVGGNSTGCLNGALSYQVDTGTPATPSSLTLQSPTTSPNLDTTPTVRVAGVVTGDVIRLYTNNTCTTEVASATATGTTIDLTPAAMSDGTYDFYAKATDPAGNASLCSTATVQYVLDTVAPSAPSALSLQSPTTSPNNDTTPTIRVSGVSSGHTIKLYSNNTCTTEVATGTAAGTTIDLTTGALIDGPYDFYARATDVAGNVSSCSTATVHYVLDTVASSAPTGLALQLPATSPNKDNTPTIRVSGVTSADTIKIYTNNTCATEVASGVAAGATIDLSASTLADGAYDFYAKAIDPAGNNSACSTATVHYDLDTVVPTAPNSLSLQNPATSPNNVTTPTITVGGVVAGHAVKLFTNNTCSTQVGSGTAGAATIDLTSSILVDGTYIFYAMSTDLAGNDSSCSVASVSYTLDTVPPSTPSSLTLQDPASSPGNDVTPTIRVGGVANGSTVKLFSNNTCTTELASAVSAGTTVDLTSSVLSEGSHDFYAKATDAAGNVSGCSTATVHYDLDVVAPTVTISTASSSPFYTPLVSYTVTLSETVTGFAIGDISVTNGTAQNFSGTGTSFSFEVVPAAAGTVSVVINAGAFTDPSGNANTVSNTLNLTYHVPVWSQQAYIKAGNAGASDLFGSSVAISGDTLAVGAYDEDSNQTVITNGTGTSSNNTALSSGAVYVYRRSGVSWAQQAYIKATNGEAADEFGRSVAISGDTLVVGATKEKSNQTTITNGTTASNDNSITDPGAVYVYRRNGTAWSQEAYIKAANADSSDEFGSAVAVSDNTLVVGATLEDSNQTTITNGSTAITNNSAGDSGAVYVYRRSGGTWSQEAYIKAVNAGWLDNFGGSVSISGDTLVVGAHLEDSNQNTITNGATVTSNDLASSAGAVYVYRRSGVSWSQEAYIKAANAGGSDYFGRSVSISGNTLAVGADSEDSNQIIITNGSTASSNNTATDSGAVYIYRRSGVNWSQEAYIKAANTGGSDFFGNALSVYGDVVVVGAYKEDSNQITITNGTTASSDNSAADAGAVYVYRRDGTTWSPDAYIKAANAEAGDYFGQEVAISDETIVVGASTEDSNQTTITNGTTASSSNVATDSGAVYVYARSQATAVVSSNGVGDFSSTTTLNIDVGGSDIKYYRYKIGPAGSTNCSDITGYTANIDESLPIIDNISGLPDGEIVLCIIGETTGGITQATSRASVVRWIKDTVAPTTPSSVADGVATWTDVNTTPAFSWGASTDATSGVLQYEVSMGSTAGSTDQEGWTAISSNQLTWTFTNRFFAYETVVYFNIRAKDAAGNTSGVASSNGFTVVCNPAAGWCPQAYLKAANAGLSDNFGTSVAISGDTVAVGATGEASNQTFITNGTTASANNSLSSAGAVYVYRRSGVTWAQEAYIKASNVGSDDEFGSSVAMSGDTLVVGAQKEDSAQTTITNGSTASSDNDATDSGAVYVYRRSGGSWSQQAYIKAVNAEANDGFGSSVAISGDTLVVGAYAEDSNQTTITNDSSASVNNSAAGSGAVYVYRRSGVTWSQEAYIKAANADPYDVFGLDVAISGDTVVVGAYYEDSNQTAITNGATASSDNTKFNSGAVYVYRRAGGTWSQEAYLKAINSEAEDYFGSRLAISGDTVVVGAHREDSNQTTITNGTTASGDNSKIDSGAVYVYRRSGVTWSRQAYLKASNVDAHDNFGYSVDISGDTVVVGAYSENSNQITITNGTTASSDNSASDAGAVYVYRRSGTTWSQEAYIKAANAEVSDNFGKDVAISDETIVVGAASEDSNQITITNGSSASINNGASNSGAVYVYTRSQATAAVSSNGIGDFSSTTTLNIDVGGSDIKYYRYKIGPAGSTDCSNITGYSANINESVPITDNISGLPDGEIVLCIIGETTGGITQATSRASVVRWIKDTVAPTTPSSVVDGVVTWGRGDESPAFSWGASTDATSGVLQYEVSMGSSAGLTDHVGWTAISSNQLTWIFTNTAFAYETVVYFNIRAKDAAGNTSSVASSDGYTVACDPTGWCQQAYIKAANAGSNDYFGKSVAISGDTVAVGATGEASNQTFITNGSTASGDNSQTGAGAVYVYRRSGVSWSQEAYIKAVNLNVNDLFGYSVALNGDTLVVGAYVEDSNQTTITNGTTASSDNGLSDSGAVYVYRRSGVNWSQEAYIKAVNAGANDRFGWSVAVSGDTVVVGATAESSSQSTITNGATASSDNALYYAGAVYVYRRSGINWSQEAYIKADKPGVGDEFGTAVAVHGDTVVVGASNESSSQTTITNGTTASSDNGAGSAGAVYVYRRTGTNWAQEAFIKAANAAADDDFGVSVDISGDTVVVGAYGEDSNQTTITNGATASNDNSLSGAGAVYVYRRNGVLWSPEAYIKPVNAGGLDYFGKKVSISGDIITVGAEDEDSNKKTVTNGPFASSNNSVLGSGSAYIFRRSGVLWSQEAYLKASNVEANDKFGSSVAISGDTVVVGATDEDSNQTTITNGVLASSNNSASLSGAVYVYYYGPGLSSIKRFTQVDVDYSHLRLGEDTTVYVEYSDDNSAWTVAKSQVLIPGSRNVYTLSWDDKGVHRYWRLRFADPNDGVIGGVDELYEVSFYQLNGVQVSPATATRIATQFNTPSNAEDQSSGTAAVWDGSDSGGISWDFGP